MILFLKWVDMNTSRPFSCLEMPLSSLFFVWVLQTAVGGGDGDIGKKNFHGGDDDDFFDDFDEKDDGDEGGIFRHSS